LFLALLLAVPIALNIALPIYNTVNPKLAGLPFFWWFQILLLGICVPPYLAFALIDNLRTKDTASIGA
jgi:hypothetical protein